MIIRLENEAFSWHFYKERGKTMEIHQFIRHFRRKLHFTQKEILPDLDPSVYSRIEGGKQELKRNDLKTIMNTLSLTEEEISLNAPLDTEQDTFKALFHYCSRNLTNPHKKEQLLEHYETLSVKFKNLQELSNYIAIKSYFYQFWEEVDPVTEKELQATYQLLMNKNFYQKYDYVILINIIRLLDKKEADLIVSKIFTIKQLNEDIVFLDSLVQNILTNVLTARIYEKDYDSTRRYIHLAKKLDKSHKSMFFQSHIKYLENLLDYLTTGDYKYIQRIQEYINLLKDIGNNNDAEQIEIEIKVVIHDILDTTRKSKLAAILTKT